MTHGDEINPDEINPQPSNYASWSAYHRIDNMQRYRTDEWHDYKPSLLRRLIDRLRRSR